MKTCKNNPDSENQSTLPPRHPLHPAHIPPELLEVDPLSFERLPCLPHGNRLPLGREAARLRTLILHDFDPTKEQILLPHTRQAVLERNDLPPANLLTTCGGGVELVHRPHEPAPVRFGVQEDGRLEIVQPERPRGYKVVGGHHGGEVEIPGLVHHQICRLGPDPSRLDGRHDALAEHGFLVVMLTFRVRVRVRFRFRIRIRIRRPARREGLVPLPRHAHRDLAVLEADAAPPRCRVGGGAGEEVERPGAEEAEEGPVEEEHEGSFDGDGE